MQKKIFWGCFVLSIIVFSIVLGDRFLDQYNQKKNLNFRPKLVVYSYSSFLGAYGPSSEIKKIFEQECHCEVVYIDVEEAGFLISKVLLAREKQVDIVLGMEHLDLREASQKLEWKKITVKKSILEKPIRGFEYDFFRPFNYSPMGYIYKGEKRPAVSYEELSSDTFKIGIQNPKMSSPGLKWLYWQSQLFGANELDDSLEKIKKGISSVSPSWSSSYGLFKNQVKMDYVFSFLTSLAYHWGEEKDRSFNFLEVSEGHPLHIEYMGIPKQCWNCDIAMDFVAFLFRPSTQKIIMEKNFMLPAVEGVRSGIFSELPHIDNVLAEGMDEFLDKKNEHIEAWSNSFKGL